MKAGAGGEPRVGLEIHARLATETKLFCPCPNRFGAPPNAHTCEVCTGQPGALPVLNERALALAVRAALALGAEVAPTSRFDRKHYFYPDLPKGYQITQHERPLARGGWLRLESGRRIRLRGLHLEEDAGKAVHAGDHTRVDLDRAGAPLIEIVSEPDLACAAEAADLLARVREILRYAGVCDGDMEKGSLRCDVNVSLGAADGSPGVRVELKNLNSFRHVRDAVDFELARQRKRGARVVRETRLWDPERGETRPLRAKEDLGDYRFLPEADLPPVVVTEELLARERALVPEPPADRRARYRDRFGLGEYDARVLTAERGRAELFEEAVRLGADARRVARWLINDVPAARGKGGLTPRRLATLSALVADGTLGTAGARRVLGALSEEDADPRELVERLGLARVADEATLRAWCRAALAQRPDVADAVRAGQTRALHAALGQVMGASGGRADPERARALLLRLIEEAR